MIEPEEELTIKLIQNDMKSLRGKDGLKDLEKLNISQNKPLFESTVIDQMSQMKKKWLESPKLFEIIRRDKWGWTKRQAKISFPNNQIRQQKAQTQWEEL